MTIWSKSFNLQMGNLQCSSEDVILQRPPGTSRRYPCWSQQCYRPQSSPSDSASLTATANVSLGPRLSSLTSCLVFHSLKSPTKHFCHSSHQVTSPGRPSCSLWLRGPSPSPHSALPPKDLLACPGADADGGGRHHKPHRQAPEQGC